jgi:taurine dioxygenase
MERQLRITPISPNIGAEISGVDLRQPVSSPDYEAIHRALMEYEVLVFRKQHLTSEQQVAFGKQFGALTVHPFSPNRSDLPELIVLDNHKDNPPRLSDVWHSDETFRQEPPMGTILRAVITPELGGDTLFASMTAAYDTLSGPVKTLIEGLDALHDFKPFRTLFGEDPEGRTKLQKMEKQYPNPLHPVVRIHPVTGRKVLFVNPQFTISLQGLKEVESRHILDILFNQAHVPEHQLRLHWETGTVAFWDNRSVQHYAVHDYCPQRRKMERITLKGDIPFGSDSHPLPEVWPRPEMSYRNEDEIPDTSRRHFER